MITLIFAILTFALLIKLNEIIGFRVGFRFERENLHDQVLEDSEIMEVTEDERILETVRSGCLGFNQETFLKKAEKVFEMVFKAYAEGDKATLKDLLSPRTFKAFSMAIDERKTQGETLEGSILQFVEISLVDAKIKGDNLFVTVKFITDQTTVLKSRDGTILEGNPEYVDSRTDVWVFSRKVNSADPRWFLHEIKSED